LFPINTHSLHLTTLSISARLGPTTAFIMCRHEYASYACGHHRDLGHFCSNAQSAALPSKVHCTQYVPLPEMHYSTQCGRRNGFYCGETQDGRLIDTFQDAMDRMKIEAAMRKSEAESSKLQCANCVSEAKTRGVPTEDLQTLPTYVMLKQRHDAAMVRYTVLCGKYKVLLPIVDYAHKNRNLLEPGVRYQPFWNGTSFDFKNTIFPMQLLQPIFHILPGYNPAQTPQTIPPGGTAVNLQQDSYVTNNMSTGSGLDSEPAVGHKSAPSQRPKLTVSTTSNQPVFIRQVVSVTEQGSPVSHSKVRPKVMTPIRGETPEGEAHTEKAVRYLKQLEVEGEKYVAKAMTDAGYDVARYGIRPLPKMGRKYEELRWKLLENYTDTKQTDGKLSPSPLCPTRKSPKRHPRRKEGSPQRQKTLRRPHQTSAAARGHKTTSRSMWMPLKTVPALARPSPTSQMPLGTTFSTNRTEPTLKARLCLRPRLHQSRLHGAPWDATSRPTWQAHRVAVRTQTRSL
jgi:hypothetical protein